MRKRYDKGEHEIARLRGALEQIKVTCDGNKSAACHHDMALDFVGEVAAHALAFQTSQSEE